MGNYDVLASEPQYCGSKISCAVASTDLSKEAGTLFEVGKEIMKSICTHEENGVLNDNLSANCCHCAVLKQKFGYTLFY